MLPVQRSLWRRRPFLTFAAATGVGITLAAGYDHFYQYDSMIRTVRTAWNGAILAADYKIFFREGYDIEKLHERVSKRIFNVCQKNGGLYIKFGQQIASMNQVLPKQYQETFSALYDRAPVVGYDVVTQIFQEEFGKNPDEVFSEFDAQPVASASIAQVHKAKLKDGTEVAVKIQKPQIAIQMGWDLFAYKYLTIGLEYLFDMPLTWSVDYVITHLKQEVDFVNEAKNSEIAARHIRQEPGLRDKVHVPVVYHDYSSKRVMTAEWIDGIPFSNMQALKDAKYDQMDLMHTIVSTFAHQIFFTGFLHCDPHPGNIIIRRLENKKPQVVLLDHGLYMKESEDFKQQYCRMWKSIFLMDIPTMDEICKDWGIGNSAVFATMTLQKPYSSKVAVHMGDASTRDALQSMYRVQHDFKRYAKKMLADTARLPKEIVFVGRNLNLVRANNLFVGSPVNRINIMAQWAVRGLDRDINTWARRRNLKTIEERGFFSQNWLRLQFYVTTKIELIRFNLTLKGISFAYNFWTSYGLIKDKFSTEKTNDKKNEVDQLVIQQLEGISKKFGVNVTRKSWDG